MRKVIFLLLAAGTWYFAGMYHSVSLMTLTVTELACFVCMFFLSLYLKSSLSIRFRENSAALTKGEDRVSSLKAVNSGRLPVGDYLIRFAVRDPQGHRDEKKESAGGVKARGEGSPALSFSAEWCGIYTLELKSVHVTDYLRLFRRKRKLAEKLEAVVLPPPRKLALSLNPENAADEAVLTETSPFSGKNPEEIHHLREYMPGDPYRWIHWNQSARTGQLWVKVHSQPRGTQVTLFLKQSEQEKQRPGKQKAEQKEAFYEILYALLLGLLEDEYFILVRGREDTEESVPAEQLLTGREDCDGLFRLLYQQEKDWLLEEVPDGQGLCLGTDLALSWRGKEIFQFSREHYVEELETVVLRA